MDHNLEDSLTMESIENMDFEHAGVEVTQEDISLEDSSHADNISMEIDTIQEHHTLLDGANEEVIVSDLIGDQFGFQEYSVQAENSSGTNITIEGNQLVLMDSTAQNEQIVDMQYAESAKSTTSQPGLITIKAIPQQRSITKKSTATAPYPRQVAIAPKPIKGAPNVQYAIAPKPVSIMLNKNATPKKIPMKTVVQNLKGNTVLAQIGKQLVMMPAGAAGHKLKLASIIPGGSADRSNIQLVRCNPDSAQLISNQGGKPVRTKFIVQGQSNTDLTNQPAVITKIMPVTSSAPTQARYIMQQKTVPISIGGSKVVLTSPTKQGGVQVASKKQIISIKTESPKVVTSQANVQARKVVITANPTTSQAKISGTKTVTQTQGQRTQLHPINVPGKGIQYIKLVTNQPALQKTAPKPQSLSISGKNFVLTDSKGNIIQMSSDKVLSSQPPPLLVTATTTAASQVATKGRKLVRIAPISAKSETSSAKVREVTKMAYCVEPKVPRASQSLLMPREQTVLSGTSVSLEEFNEMVDQTNLSSLGLKEEVAREPQNNDEMVEEDYNVEQPLQENMDVKPTLASLMSNTVAGDESFDDMSHMTEVEIEYENTPRKQEQYYQEEESTNSMDHESSNERHDESIVIVPSVTHNTTEDDHMYKDETHSSMDDSNRMQTVVTVEADVVPYLPSDMDQTYSDSMLMFEGGAGGGGGGGAGALRPRKACNCTKSQCLKLYCDCFANGEFCNQCNCNNCFNNLDHEDTRQKAIRACLERNPNAFRPKIGKSKAGGPEIVRRHNKGCNCKRSGCLKNYCECYEAKIACTLMCKCVGCRNIEETLERRRDAIRLRDKLSDPSFRTPLPMGQVKQPCNFMTSEVIEAVAQCMLAAAGDETPREDADAVEDILLEFSRCMADIISASHHSL